MPTTAQKQGADKRWHRMVAVTDPQAQAGLVFPAHISEMDCHGYLL
jgi:hypothetical protein